MTMLGRDDLATIAPHLAGVGQITPGLARHLAATTNPTLRAVLTLGPWLPISVSRTQRVLPDWLRTAVHAIHPACIGPGCDLPFDATQADHRNEWHNGGPTSLTNTAPLCAGHNQLKHTAGWTVTFDFTTGIHTWTSRDKTKTIHVPPKTPQPTPAASATRSTGPPAGDW